jgi:ABC-type transporter Mla MlaB component
MIRVTKIEQRSSTTLTVDGQLSSDAIGIVENCCSQAESGGKPVKLYLRDVTYVDQAGRSLLTRLAAKGVRLAANGVYTSYLVNALARFAGSPAGSHNGGAFGRRKRR